MGSGKTAVSRILKEKLDNSVFLDGDWCWDAHPFQVTEETKQMVLQNIRFLLNQFIHCSAYQNIVFCWVLHEQGIIDTVLESLDKSDCSVQVFSLLCSETELRRRLTEDIAAGIRSADVVERSVARIPGYGEAEYDKNPDGREKPVGNRRGNFSISPALRQCLHPLIERRQTARLKRLSGEFSCEAENLQSA